MKYYGSVNITTVQMVIYRHVKFWGVKNFIEVCVEYEYTCCISVKTAKRTVCMNTYICTVYSILYMCMCVCVCVR